MIYNHLIVPAMKAKCPHFVQSFNMFNTLCALTWNEAESKILWSSFLCWLHMVLK